MEIQAYHLVRHDEKTRKPIFIGAYKFVITRSELKNQLNKKIPGISDSVVSNFLDTIQTLVGVQIPNIPEAVSGSSYGDYECVTTYKGLALMSLTLQKFGIKIIYPSKDDTLNH